eukprot:COSAG03_NODE_19043_length_343_cov_1.262295_1_plen_62_part_01
MSVCACACACERERERERERDREREGEKERESKKTHSAIRRMFSVRSSAENPSPAFSPNRML